MRSGNLSCSGPYDLDLQDQFFVAQAFVGAGGVHPDAGVTDYHAGEGSLRRQWLKRAAAFYVLADSGKLGAIAPYWVASLETVTALVTDSEERRDVLDHLKTSDTEVIVARPSVERATGDPHRRRGRRVSAIPAAGKTGTEAN